MTAPIQIAIIGFGWVARDYFYPALQLVNGVALAAICDPFLNEENVPEQVPHYTSLAKLFDQQNIDAVYIATPNNVHAEQVQICAEHGVHILCEKPLAANLQGGQQIANYVTQSNIIFLSAFDQRYHPAHIAIKKQIKTGKLGVVTQVRLDYACWLDREWASNNWRINLEEAGGGAIIDLAPHGLDLVEFILNDTIEKLQILGQNRVQEYEVDDGGVLNFRTKNQILGSSSVGYNRPEKLPRRQLEFYGTKGKLRAENTMGQDAGGMLYFTDAGTGIESEIPI